MSSKDLEVRTVLDLLSDKMSERAQLLNGQCTSNSLYDIKSMSSEEKEVSDILGGLSEKILASEGMMNERRSAIRCIVSRA